MKLLRKHARIALAVMLVLTLLPLMALAASSAVPREALRYQRDLTRHARSVWGMDAPVAVFAAQIHQESRWNKDARSKFAGGLAQFTPDTAAWISGAYPKELGSNQPLNPAWAMRALVTYDKQLYGRAKADTPCSKMWKDLWGYNGGEGWVARDEKLAAMHGADIRNYAEVEPFNAGRAPAMFAENRGYPRAILIKWQPIYASWGGEIKCI